jgi:hypothetical protein
MKIVIFGIGISGRAIYRKLKDEHTIVNFIDNNPDLENTTYDNIEILSVNNVVNIDFDKIAIGGVWFEDMKKQLLNLDISKDKIWFIEDDALNFSTDTRDKITTNILKSLVDIFNKKNISYCMEGSSLLCLLRKQKLSDVSDVDILVKSQDDLEIIWQDIQQDKELMKYHLTKRTYKEDKILTKKGQIDKIVIKSKLDSSLEEPTVIDINFIIDIGKYYILDYMHDYFYINKEYIDGENIFVYQDIPLLIPSQPEKYAELIYGKNWRIPAKKWSYKDYGNLINSQELIDLMNTQ